MNFDTQTDSDTVSGGIAADKYDEYLLSELVHEVSRLADAVEEMNEQRRREQEGRR